MRADTVQSLRSDSIRRLSRDGHFAWFGGMLERTMAPLLRCPDPSLVGQSAKHLANRHAQFTLEPGNAAPAIVDAFAAWNKTVERAGPALLRRPTASRLKTQMRRSDCFSAVKSPGRLPLPALRAFHVGPLFRRRDRSGSLLRTFANARLLLHNTAARDTRNSESTPVADTSPAPAPANGAAAIEKPACFYLGREYDLATKTVVADGYVMYDARDLTTHGVVVGMTGSRQDRPVHQPPRRGRHRRHSFHHHRPQGRSDESAVAVPRPRSEATSRSGSTRTTPAQKGRSRGAVRREAGGPLAQGSGQDNGPDAGAHRPAEGGRRLAHLHARQRGGAAAVHPRHLRRPEGQDAARGADAEDRRHGHGPARPDRHRQPTRCSRANTSSSRKLLAARLEPPAATSTSPA